MDVDPEDGYTVHFDPATRKIDVNASVLPAAVIESCGCNIKLVENAFSIGLYKILFVFSVGISCMAYYTGHVSIAFVSVQLKKEFDLTNLFYTSMVSWGLLASTASTATALLADVYGRNSMYIVALSGFILSVLMFVNAPEKYSLFASYMGMRFFGESIYVIDMLYINEKTSQQWRNVVVLSLFLLESCALLLVQGLNFWFANYKVAFLGILGLAVAGLAMRFLFVESYMWLNRVDRPAEACQAINYIAQFQSDPFMVVYLVNEEYALKNKSYVKNKSSYSIQPIELLEPKEYEDQYKQQQKHSHLFELSDYSPYVDNGCTNIDIDSSNTQCLSNRGLNIFDRTNMSIANKVSYIFDQSNPLFWKGIVFLCYAGVSYNTLASTMSLIPDYWSSYYLEDSEVRLLNVYSLLVMIASLVVFLCGVNWLNAPLSCLVIHVGQILLVYGLICDLWGPGLWQKAFYVGGTGLIYGSGRLWISFYSVIACNCSNTENRGTFFMLLTISGNFTVFGLNLAVGYLYQENEGLALQLSNAFSWIAVGMIILYLYMFYEQGEVLPE